MRPPLPRCEKRDRVPRRIRSGHALAADEPPQRVAPLSTNRPPTADCRPPTTDRRRLDVCSGMATKRRAFISLLLLALFGAGIPLLERWIKCQQPLSEACVWAKAYLPLSFAIGAAIGLLAALLAWFVLGGRTDS